MKMSRIVGLLWLAALIWLVPGHLVHAASPVIKDFSSKGGHALNKDNARDTMYLVKPADKITFKVKVEGAEKYEWLVNKTGQDAKGDTFTWNVPDKKGICDPKADYSKESAPNGGRVNTGAYGNTPQASKSAKK